MMRTKLGPRIQQKWRICIFAIFLSVFSLNVSAEKQIFTGLDKSRIEIDFDNPGKPAVFMVWASWCPYCIAEMPKLIELYHQYPDFLWMGVNVNKNPADGRSVELEKGLPYKSIADADLVFSDQFKVRGTPNFIIIDKQGKVIHKGRRVNDAFLDVLKGFDA